MVSPEPQRVVLAREQPFRLGDLLVEPQMRRLGRGGEKVTVEPRVMQVLVALARGGGAVVTREELIESCWNGRVVGDDSIQRAIGQLRQLSAGIGHGRFSIETIARVGYRLVGSEAFGDNGLDKLPRRYVTGGILVLAASVAGGALVMSNRRSSGEAQPLALQHYRRGLENRGQASLIQAEQSVAYLREATRIDPAFAEAWGALAWAYRALLEYGPRNDAARLEAFGRSAAARALELDPTSADAQAALLLLKPIYRNWRQIEVGCRRILQRHPNHSITQYNLGLVFSEVGRWADSHQQLREVADREPFWPLPRLRLIHSLLARNRIHEAEELLESSLARWPKRSDFWSIKLRYLLVSNQLVEAFRFSNDPQHRPAQQHPFELQVVQAMASRSSALKSHTLSQIEESTKADPRLSVAAAIHCGLLGDLDTAFGILDGYYFGRGIWKDLRHQRPDTSCLFILPTAPLRRDPRFAALVRDIGVERYWAQSRSRPDYRDSV
jgi:DNA-binding winged helix-turn-helix (wHTH) protein/tetratricopeptide (TPR) repeat protein